MDDVIVEREFGGHRGKFGARIGADFDELRELAAVVHRAQRAEERGDVFARDIRADVEQQERRAIFTREFGSLSRLAGCA